MKRMILLAVSILLAPSSGPQAAARQETLFPLVSGWTLTPGDMVYTRGNLWDAIDGAAEVFLEFGFIDMHVGEYSGSGGKDVRVELYRHSSPLNAFGMYSQERYPEYHFIDIGTQGYAEEKVLNFFSGPFYVKMTTHAAGDSGKSALIEIAREIERHLRQEKSWPVLLAAFPFAGRIANTESYVAENFLGYAFLNGAFVAEYRPKGKLFVVPFSSSTQADSSAAKYLKAIGSPGSLDDGRIREAGVKTAGGDLLLLSGKYLCGTIGVVRTEDARILLELLRGRLP